VNVIVKLHPISYCSPDGPNYQFYTGGVDWVKEFSEFESQENFRHVPVSNIDPLLAASDVMVTDVSSVALEFVMLDRPVIYIDCPEFFEKTLAKVYSNFGKTTAEFVKNDPKANAGRHTGVVVERIEELQDAVKRCLNNPSELSAKRTELARQLSYNPGNAGEVAADTILKILKI
jgi:CDP-glycerol glycerophosphotransferase (TagB/SpsB family)